MKLASVVVACVTVGGAVAHQHDYSYSYEYMGYNATNNSENDLALCGKNLWGCVSVPSSTRGCKSNAQLGSLQDIGSDAQTWIYEDGLLKTRQPYSSWGSTYELCLGPKESVELPLQAGQEYRLAVQKCQDTRHFRWLLADGRVQSLAEVAGSLSVPYWYCMSIDAAVPMQASGSAMMLKPCDFSNDLQQLIQPYGNVEPFLSSLQSVWGLEDIVELAYETTSDAPIEVDVYLYKSGDDNLDDPLYSMKTSASSGVLFFNVSSILAEDETSGQFIAKFGDNEAIFSVSQQTHVRCGTGYSSASAMSSSASALGFVLGSAVVFCGLLGVSYYYSSYLYDNNRRSSESPAWDDQQDDKTVASEDEMRDDGEKHADADDAASETTTSNDSTEMEMISSDQA